MKFVLFVEGQTEQRAIPAFLGRWLNDRLSQNVGIKPVRFQGWPKMVKDMPKKAAMYLDGPDKNVIAVIGLLDLYGPEFYPTHCTSADERVVWATGDLEKKVNHERFKMFFAVHEVEAWLLSDPQVLPITVQNALPQSILDPEKVNFNEPPSKLLDRLYWQMNHRTYKKVVHGKALFARVDPNIAYERCPRLKEMLDHMLALARSSGL